MYQVVATEAEYLVVELEEFLTVDFPKLDSLAVGFQNLDKLVAGIQKLDTQGLMKVD